MDKSVYGNYQITRGRNQGHVIEDGALLGSLHRYIYPLWESMFKMSYLNEIPVTLKFPLLDVYKDQVIMSIPGVYRSLVWTCENPTFDKVISKPCGSCRPCTNKPHGLSYTPVKNANIDLAIEDTLSKYKEHIDGCVTLFTINDRS